MKILAHTYIVENGQVYLELALVRPHTYLILRDGQVWDARDTMREDYAVEATKDWAHPFTPAKAATQIGKANPFPSAS